MAADVDEAEDGVGRGVAAGEPPEGLAGEKLERARLVAREGDERRVFEGASAG